jgi:hypothetical protein
LSVRSSLKSAPAPASRCGFFAFGGFLSGNAVDFSQPPHQLHHTTAFSAAEGPPLSHGCAVPAAYCGRPLLSLCDISPTPWGNRPPKGEPRACGAVICIENRRARNSATHLLHTNEQRRSRVLPPLGNSPVRGNVAKRQRGLLPLLRGAPSAARLKRLEGGGTIWLPRCRGSCRA